MDGINLESAALFNPSHPGDRNWRLAGAGDFDTDGNLDLLFQHSDGTLAMWFLNATALSRASALSPSNPGAGWRVVSTVDRNQDNEPDSLFQSAVDGSLTLWLMDGINRTAVQQLNPSKPGGTWKVVAPK